MGHGWVPYGSDLRWNAILSVPGDPMVGPHVGERGGRREGGTLVFCSVVVYYFSPSMCPIRWMTITISIAPTTTTMMMAPTTPYTSAQVCVLDL